MARIAGSWCVLAVRDLKMSTEYYIEVLGFTRSRIDAKGWSFLTRDNFKVMLGECANEKPASDLGDHANRQALGTAVRQSKVMRNVQTEHTGASYDSIAGKYAATVDAKPWNADYERPALLSLLPSLSGIKVLDAGCGPGWCRIPRQPGRRGDRL